ncbi:indoleamine 2,3-dioxygenase 1-like isoform X1 [Malaclemys terrapin pileata]|uniref:indoleamine 2,3-dioxygenase 1-like isoform X1 n=1 Tax=Malaclemys terrapin pileata TaxID=2991368 RepID=UPI0023A8422A|nr:indoleamine 2,3-dioxygenase 1-like isoform X1 [Malaclemys terrapin pileata]XP_053875518.1 indoleamine 2,3-dioxygenase 1-like isoform X1 [Malaclemys terrapin pileata]
MEHEDKSESLQNLEEFHVSEEYGFVLPDPLTELPDYYAPWMNVAANLPHLIEGHQLRREVAKMPLLSTQYLRGHRQLRLARLALGFITMGYVWQGGGRQTVKILPRALAVPYCTISELLDLPPILVYADCVLANWKKRDPCGPLNTENLDILFSFPGGDSNKGFFLVSLLVEAAAAAGIKAIPIIVNAILHHGLCSLETALQDVALSICKMREAFKLIHECVNPGVFFRSLRIYLSGWKDNFLMPEGLVYEGVWDSPKQFFGGSAAQSSTLQCFDVLLGIQHSTTQGFSAEYLSCMRDYMPAAHRAFIQTLASGPSLRQFVLATGDAGLHAAFNKCVSVLADLRSYHIQIATKYITIPAGRCRVEQQQLGGCVHEGMSVLSERGTGGTGFMRFLKAIRDTTQKAQLTEEAATVPTH